MPNVVKDMRYVDTGFRIQKRPTETTQAGLTLGSKIKCDGLLNEYRLDTLLSYVYRGDPMFAEKNQREHRIALARHIYSDTLQTLDLLETLLHCGDTAMAFRHIQELRDKILGDVG